MKNDLMIWKDHVESTPYHEVRKHPAWEGGVVETRRSAQSWMWRSAIIKDVTVLTSEGIPVASVENGGTGKLVAKANPRPKPTLTLTSVSIPYCEQKWIDVGSGKYSQGCFEESKFMIRLLRHGGTIHREDDGAVRIDDLAEKFKAKVWWYFAMVNWSLENFPDKRSRRTEEEVTILLEPNCPNILYFRAIQGHSGGPLVDPTLQDNVLLPDDFVEYIYHIGNAHDMHSIIQSGLIPGRKSFKRDSQSVFFTAMNPMYANQDLEDVQYGLDKPRITVYKKTWRVQQNTVFWCNLKLAQRKGLQFYQTWSHAIALLNTLPAICFEKVV